MSSINLRFGLTALLGLIACGALAQGGRSAGATNALSASAAATIRQWGISLRDTVTGRVQLRFRPPRPRPHPLTKAVSYRLCGM